MRFLTTMPRARLPWVAPLAVVLVLLAQARPVAPYNNVSPLSFSWAEINDMHTFPALGREALASGIDKGIGPGSLASKLDTVYVFGGYNSLVYTGDPQNFLFAQLWSLTVTGSHAANASVTWTDLTPRLTGLPAEIVPGVCAPALGIFNSRVYSVFGRTDTDIFVDLYGPTYADPTYLYIFDVTGGANAAVPVSRMPIVLGPASRNAQPLNLTALSGRFYAGYHQVNSLLYVVGGVGGPLLGTAGGFLQDIAGLASGYYLGPADSFIVIDLATGIALRLATINGPTASDVAPNGKIYPVVFSSRGGARIHCFTGNDYLTNSILDSSTLWTYDVATDTWSSSNLNARTGMAWALSAAVGDGVVVIGGDTHPSVSGSGFGSTNIAFLIDASADPPFVRSLPSAALAREAGRAALLSTGLGVTFLGASYRSLGPGPAYNYYPQTQIFTAFTPSSSESALSPGRGLVAAIALLLVLGFAPI